MAKSPKSSIEEHFGLLEDPRSSINRQHNDLAQSNFTAFEHTHATTTEKGHGRIETRKAWLISDPRLSSICAMQRSGRS
jgi:hypothetical protein